MACIVIVFDPRVKEYAPINSLLDKLNKSKVSISIQNEVLVKGVSVPASCSSPNASGMIIIRARADDVNMTYSRAENTFRSYPFSYYSDLPNDV